MELPVPRLELARAETPTDIRERAIADFLAAKSFAPRTEKQYRRQLARFAAWTDKPWLDLTARDILRFKQHLETTTDLAPTSIAVALAAVKSFLSWQWQSGQRLDNPGSAVSQPALPQPEPQHFTDEEVERLYAALEHSGSAQLRDTALLALLDHGLRAGEVAALTLGDYERDRPRDARRVWVRGAKAGSDGVVPLLPVACDALDAYLEERFVDGEDLDDPDAPLLRSQSAASSGRLTYSGIYYLLRSLGEKAGVKNCHPHRLRHTFCTRLVLAGVEAFHARHLSRHRSEGSFARYAKYGRQVAAEQVFREKLGGSEHPLADDEGNR